MNAIEIEQTSFAALNGQVCIQGASAPIMLSMEVPAVMGSDDFESPYVDKQHAEIKLDHEGIWLRDLGSKNGTRLNGQLLISKRWYFWSLGTTAQLANCPIKIGVQESIAEQPLANVTDLLEQAQASLLKDPNAVRNQAWWQQFGCDHNHVDQMESLLTGLGPLEPLLKDDQISEIMVQGTKPIWVERAGVIEQTKTSFPSDEWLERTIERVLKPIGRQINQHQPLCDGRLADGSRVNAVLSPISLGGASLTIRKFQSHANSLKTWVKHNGLPARWADWLAEQVANGRDMLVVGGTGAGKTTFLNALAEFIPANQRLISIEDAAELDLNHDHWIRMETRRGQTPLDARALLVNALRMRPDRLVLGEVRGSEALELIQALNTGHRGCLSTLHANTAFSATRRLEMLLLLTGLDWPIDAIREQIAGAVDLIVSVKRMGNGDRKVSGIYELQGLHQGEYCWETHYAEEQL